MHLSTKLCMQEWILFKANPQICGFGKGRECHDQPTNLRSRGQARSFFFKFRSKKCNAISVFHVSYRTVIGLGLYYIMINLKSFKITDYGKRGDQSFAENFGSTIQEKIRNA